MVYVRHRDRMVQESVSQDLRNTLIACRWMPGVTTQPVFDPYAPGAGRAIVTTTQGEVLKAVGSNPINLIDSFPEASEGNGQSAAVGDQGTRTPPNTLAIDDAQPGESIPMELGSSLSEVPYRFSIAFWGANVGLAQALLNDLRDRYLGRIVETDFIPLYDYNVDPTMPVVSMEVDSFAYARDVEEIAPHELTLFFAQLVITDYVE